MYKINKKGKKQNSLSQTTKQISVQLAENKIIVNARAIAGFLFPTASPSPRHQK